MTTDSLASASGRAAGSGIRITIAAAVGALPTTVAVLPATAGDDSCLTGASDGARVVVADSFWVHEMVSNADAYTRPFSNCLTISYPISLAQRDTRYLTAQRFAPASRSVGSPAGNSPLSFNATMRSKFGGVDGRFEVTRSTKAGS